MIHRALKSNFPLQHLLIEIRVYSVEIVYSTELVSSCDKLSNRTLWGSKTQHYTNTKIEFKVYKNFPFILPNEADLLLRNVSVIQSMISNLNRKIKSIHESVGRVGQSIWYNTCMTDWGKHAVSISLLKNWNETELRGASHESYFYRYALPYRL
jgi:hypothetical protein